MCSRLRPSSVTARPEALRARHLETKPSRPCFDCAERQVSESSPQDETLRPGGTTEDAYETLGGEASLIPKDFIFWMRVFRWILRMRAASDWFQWVRFRALSTYCRSKLSRA
jgi:hypothetical protein